MSDGRLPNHNPYYDGDPYAPLEQLQMWPEDPRYIQAKSEYPEVQEPLPPLSWLSTPDGKAASHWRHAYHTPSSPVSQPQWRVEWLKEPDDMPEVGNSSSATKIPSLPIEYERIHYNIRAPFGGRKWKDLVNYWRREGERGGRDLSDYRTFGHYINWADEHCSELIGKVRAMPIHGNVYS